MSAQVVTNIPAWSLQVAGLVIAAALLARLLPVDSADVRHAWWRTVLVLCLALPLVQPWRPAEATFVADRPASVLTNAGSEIASPDPPGSASGLRGGINLPPVPVLVGVAWALGSALRLGWLAAGLFRLRRLRVAGTRASSFPLYLELQPLVQARAEIRYVEALGQPVTFGIRHAVVLLPSSLRALPSEVQRAVLAHELWHVRRRDWSWVLAEEALRSVLWFHPAIWWLISRVQSSREEVVDQLTVLLTNSRRGYLEALLAFADEPRVFPATPFAQRRHLFTRMLLVSKEAVMSSRRVVGSCAGMLAGVLLAGS
jgi:beta-lactamase regulating signal transducer with metallopeptidase domain